MISMDQDEQWMQLALQLASKAGPETAPNPKVGCVLVRDGRVLGQGWTQAVGQAHAEVQALRDAQAYSADVRGATAYVTLEPCSHYGRTPPCANALIEAGIARVVAALEDPNPLVAGKGFAMLRAAGIAVQSGVLAESAREMNLGFLKRMETGRPWVRMKIAASLDGKTALPNGVSQWITEPAARQDGHVWRARADAILTGVGTVLADDPLLNVRGLEVSSNEGEIEGEIKQPIKIVLDSALRISPQAQLLQSGETWLVRAQESEKITQAQTVLEQMGAQVLYIPNAQVQVDLPALMMELGRRQINEVHVEAGAQLNGALLAQDCVDELLIYMAPKLLGAGRGMLDLPVLEKISDARQLRLHEVTQVGETVRLRLRVIR